MAQTKPEGRIWPRRSFLCGTEMICGLFFFLVVQMSPVQNQSQIIQFVKGHKTTEMFSSSAEQPRLRQIIESAITIKFVDPQFIQAACKNTVVGMNYIFKSRIKSNSNNSSPEAMKNLKYVIVWQIQSSILSHNKMKSFTNIITVHLKSFACSDHLFF